MATMYGSFESEGWRIIPLVASINVLPPRRTLQGYISEIERGCLLGIRRGRKASGASPNGLIGKQLRGRKLPICQEQIGQGGRLQRGASGRGVGGLPAV
ncbi:hypothetical protein KM043_009572 [Ampulex compressa]|nr:hypothetical protein KM043_009572 [Ampulex compressa]